MKLSFLFKQDFFLNALLLANTLSKRNYYEVLNNYYLNAASRSAANKDHVQDWAGKNLHQSELSNDDVTQRAEIGHALFLPWPHATVYTDNLFRNLLESNRNQIVFIICRFIWKQTTVCLVHNQSKK